MTTTSPSRSGANRARVGVQRFGTFLSGMIMPNIAAFIAWGFITMLFIAVGWLGWWHPVADLLGGFGNADTVGWHGAMTALADVRASLLIHTLDDARRVAEAALAADDAASARAAAQAASPTQKETDR